MDLIWFSWSSPFSSYFRFNLRKLRSVWRRFRSFSRVASFVKRLSIVSICFLFSAYSLSTSVVYLFVKLLFSMTNCLILISKSFTMKLLSTGSLLFWSYSLRSWIFDSNVSFSYCHLASISPAVIGSPFPALFNWSVNCWIVFLACSNNICSYFALFSSFTKGLFLILLALYPKRNVLSVSLSL